MVKFFGFIFCFLLFFIFALDVEAANLTVVSDLISTSAPSTASNHTISFTATNNIPAGGQILIIPASNSFNIPASLDYSDIDFLVAQTPGNYINRSISSNPTPTLDGVSVVTGTSGSFIFTLNSTSGINAGNQVRILIGNNSTYQSTGDQGIINPSSIGSYRIVIETTDGANTIDTAKTFIAVIDRVAVEAEKTEGPPVMYNGSPSGSFSHTVTAIEIWLNTNEAANCRYTTTSGQSYASMINGFSQSNATLHTSVVSGLSPGASYSYYVKCSDTGGNITPLDLGISFNIRSTPPAGTNPGPVGGPEGAGGAPVVISGSSGKPYPTDRASLFFEGLAYPRSKVYILQDGVSIGNVNAGDDSKFSYDLPELNRGIYTFGFYAIDADGNKSNTTNATFSVISNTGNQISNIRILPTVKLWSNVFDLGSLIQVGGYSIAKSSVQLDIYSDLQPRTSIRKSTVMSDTSGLWSAEIGTAGLNRGSYRLRAKTILSNAESTAHTGNYFFGLGIGGDEVEVDVASGSDLNGDNKINLVDFSILLFNWGTAGGGTASDLNTDNTVNLTDFSILLFNWTG